MTKRAVTKSFFTPIETIYYSFILSNFNYCPVAWHFCSEKNTKKIEKIQERARRFIYEDYENTYENSLKKSKLPF